MDSKLSDALSKETSIDAVEYDCGIMAGFALAIELLKKNRYHGHYAHQMATWLEKHLEQEVSSKTTVTNKGY